MATFHRKTVPGIGPNDIHAIMMYEDEDLDRIGKVFGCERYGVGDDEFAKRILLSQFPNMPPPYRAQSDPLVASIERLIATATYCANKACRAPSKHAESETSMGLCFDCYEARR